MPDDVAIQRCAKHSTMLLHSAECFGCREERRAEALARLLSTARIAAHALEHGARSLRGTTAHCLRGAISKMEEFQAIRI